MGSQREFTKVQLKTREILTALYLNNKFNALQVTFSLIPLRILIATFSGRKIYIPLSIHTFIKIFISFVIYLIVLRIVV